MSKELFDAKALFEQGIKYERENKLESAFFCYKKSADKGYVYAMYNLALCYKDGKGCTIDQDLALNWMDKSASKNFHEAELSLAIMYINKSDSKLEDLERAFILLTLAAQKNNIAAIRILAEFFQQGIVVEKDLSKAFDLYQISAENGDVLAQHNLACMYQRGEGVCQNLQKACDWFEKAVSQGSQQSLQSLIDLDKNFLNPEAKISLARLKFMKKI
ncbi:MAG: tetratricopeptide repeat protein [Legionellaceae bacterium]|nr:tetratricopeptide repeat protein [Legionellaceae bacterium]